MSGISEKLGLQIHQVVALKQSGRFADAIILLRTMSATFPDVAAIWAERAIVAIKLERPDEMWRSVRTYLVQQPTAAEFLRFGAAVLRDKNPLRAFRLAVWGFAADPSDDEGSELLARLGEVVGSEIWPLRAFQLLSARHPTNWSHRRNLAAAHYKAGNEVEALDILKDLVEQQPDNQNVRVLLIEVAGAIGDWDTLESELKRAETADSETNFSRRLFRMLECRNWTNGATKEDAAELSNHLAVVAQAGELHLAAFVKTAIELDHLAPVLVRWIERDGVYATVLVIDDSGLDADHPLMPICFASPRAAIAPLRDLFALSDFGDAFSGMLELLMPAGVPTVLVGDQSVNWLTKQLYRRALRSGFPFVGLTHGEGAVLNRLIAFRDLDWETATAPDERVFTHYVFSSPDAARLGRDVVEDLEEGAVFAIGSARYAAPWVDRLSELLVPFPPNPDPSRLSIGVFAISDKFNVWWRELYRVIVMLLRLPGIHIVMQEHPRGFFTFDDANARPVPVARNPDTDRLSVERLPIEGKGSQVTIVPKGVPGARVVRGVDVCLTFGTSLSVEAVRLNKPCLELSFVTSNRTLMQEHLPEADMRCRDDVLLWVKRFSSHHGKADLGSMFYDPDRRRRFLDEVIDAGQPDVQQAYCDLLASFARTRPAN